MTAAAYDLTGRQISSTDARGNTMSYAYDNLNRLIQTETPLDVNRNGVEKTYYDKNSNTVMTKVKTEDEEYRTTEYKYDKMNRIMAVIAHDADAPSVTQYEYDTYGRMSKMLTGLSAYTAKPAGGNATVYEYDYLSRLVKTTDALGQSELIQTMIMRGICCQKQTETVLFRSIIMVFSA